MPFHSNDGNWYSMEVLTAPGPSGRNLGVRSRMGKEKPLSLIEDWGVQVHRRSEKSVWSHGVTRQSKDAWALRLHLRGSSLDLAEPVSLAPSHSPQDTLLFCSVLFSLKDIDCHNSWPWFSV